MKVTVKILMPILALIVLLSLTACGREALVDVGNERPVATPSPTPTPSQPTPDQTDPTDVSTTPMPVDPTLLTYDEALAIATAWLDKHTDLPSYAIHDWSDPPYEIPPPTYKLFREQYYEFLMSSQWDSSYSFGYSHYVLVHAETGELLSLFRVKTDEEHLTVTVELLDDWYNDEHAEYASARLTANEAIAIYNTWIDKHFDNNAEYRLNGQSHDEYVIFGEQYYYFHAEDGYKYWYNILVHTRTGELLFVEISDGMFGGEHIMPLDDWYD